MQRSTDEKWDRWNKRLRDLGLYFVGIGGAINELFSREEVRYEALLFLASILGLPSIFKQDEKRRERINEASEKAPMADGIRSHNGGTQPTVDGG